MKKLFAPLVTCLLLLITTPATAASAQPTATTPAHYRGRIIDLAADWEGARACAVLSAREIRCYDSEAEQWRDLTQRRGRPTTRTTGRTTTTATEELDTYCLNRNDLAVVLYADTNFSGSSVSLFAADVWHDLSAISFDNVTSSWRNNTYCPATAAMGSGGTGTTTTWGARSQNADVGSTWNDVVSSVMITS